MKKVFQNFNVENIDINEGLVSISNANYFTDTKGIILCWTLLENGLPIDHDTITALIAPPKQAINRIGLTQAKLKAGNE